MDIRGLKILNENGWVGILTDFDDDNATVTWPSGSTSWFKKPDFKEVLVFDSAPAGYQYTGCLCDACPDKPTIIGIRWKCNKCVDFDLCNACYHSGKHNLDHDFTRMTDQMGDDVKVAARSQSMKTVFSGFYENALVKRGKDWSYGQQDGGADKIGRVIHEVNFPENCLRSGVAVQYENGKQNYRVGYEGKVDLICTKPTSGGQCYYTHLPNLEEYRELVQVVNFLIILKQFLETHRPNNENNNTQGESKDDFLSGVDGNGNFAIHHAARNGNDEIVSYILKNTDVRDHKNKTGETPLHLAVIKGKLKIVDILIKNHFDVNIGDKHGETPFHKACRYGHLNIVKLFLQDQSLDVIITNNNGFNGFHLAVSKGYEEICDCILQFYPALISLESSNGLHVIHILFKFGRYNLFQHLITNGRIDNVNVRITSTNETALILATKKAASFTCVKLLVVHGAEIHHIDKDGNTCLHYCLKRFQTENDKRFLETYSPTYAEVISEFDHEIVTGFVLACYILQEVPNSSVFYQQHKQSFKNFSLNDSTLSLLEQFSLPKKAKRTSLPSRPKTPTAQSNNPRTSLPRSSSPASNINVNRNPPSFADAPVIHTPPFHGDVRRRQPLPQIYMSDITQPYRRSISESPDMCYFCCNDYNISIKKTIECRFKPCGHAWLCNFHGSKTRTCPKCHSIVQYIEPKDFSKKCLMCGDKEPEVVFLPCRHRTVCIACSRQCEWCSVCNYRINDKIMPPRRNNPKPDTLHDQMARMAVENDNDICQLCCDRRKDTTFLCGHRHCMACAKKLSKCPICQKTVDQIIKLFD